MRYKNFFFMLFAAFISLFAQAVLANPVIPISGSSTVTTPVFTPPTPNINANGYILIDANSGQTISEKNADSRLAPASLTKLMSLYIISNAIKSGAVRWDDKVRISPRAWKAEGSRMFVKVNDEVTVRDLVQGVAIASGNDATIALAEYIGSSEDSFADMMNNQAKLLGMQNSHFTDSSGLPNPDHFSSPRDLAMLAKHYIKNFPEDYHLFSEKWLNYSGIRQANRNRLLWRYPYADGLKTGHTKDAGFCLVASANKDGMRLISVLMGAPSDQSRTEDSIRLLNYGFRFYQTAKLYSGNEAIGDVRVWKGNKKQIPVGLAEDFYITTQVSQGKAPQTSLVVDGPVKAPVVKGQTLGTLNVIANKQIIASRPLVALEDDPKGGIWRRTMDSLGYAIQKIFSRTNNETIDNA